MKSPKLLMLSVLAGVALLTGCATSDRDYQARNTHNSAPRGQFYCELCEEYHPNQHSHYPYYNEDRYQRTAPARASNASFISQPDRSSPMGPEQDIFRPVRPVD